MSALSILTVEDDPLVRADLRLILEDNGFEVCAAARNGAEAVALAREHAPDLILIDLNLPELDGVEATRRILAERSVPIVALTGYANTGAVDRAVAAGAVGHLTKPFSERGLVEVVRAALAGRLDSAPEADQYALRILIEQLVRDGRTEREINAAVRRATGVAEPRGSSRLARLSAYLGGR
jgi:CheY-like chemotaxis protein